MEQRYIIGDLVKVNGKRGLVVETYIDADFSSIYLINDEEYKASDIQGIPLTPELFDTIKWEKLKSKRLTWWRIHLGSAYYYARQNKQDPTIWYICRGKSRHVLKRVKYYHQVQHLLFALELDGDILMLYRMHLGKY